MISLRYRLRSSERKEVSMNTIQSTTSHERAVSVPSGWIMLPALVVFLLGDLALLVFAIRNGAESSGQSQLGLFLVSLLLLPFLVLLLTGFFTLQPNEARVLVL